MGIKELFIRAVKSSCIVSIFYHIGAMLVGQPVTVRQVITFTGMFILLYFLWLVMVSARENGRNNRNNRNRRR